MRPELLLLLGAVIILITFTTGCDEDPTSVGEGILPDEDFIAIDTLIIDAYESFSVDVPTTTGGSPTLFVGENEKKRVMSIFRFDSLLTDRNITPDTIDASEVFDATLYLTPEYYLGDSTETISVELFEVLSGWSPEGFNRDVFEIINRGNESLYTSSVMLGDTNAVEFSLPRPLMRKWAEKGEQSVIPQGLILKSNEDANGIIGFGGSADDNAPRLRIIYGSEEEQDTVVFSRNARAFAANLKDDPDLQNNLIVQAGTATRAIVRFDVSELPRGALIHNAQLELTKNPYLSIPHPTIVDSLFAHHIIDVNKFTVREANRGELIRVETGENTTIYRATVSEITQAWATVEDNNGLIIRDDHETLGLHRTSFYTEQAEDATKRPRLKIIYSRL